MKKGRVLEVIMLSAMVLFMALFLVFGLFFANYSVCNLPRPVAARSQIKSFETALTNFFLDCGRFPTTEEGLEILVKLPENHPFAEKWKGPYLTGNLPLDPWGNPYIYRSPANSSQEQPYEIISLGPDGKEGGEGDNADIASWMIE